MSKKLDEHEVISKLKELANELGRTPTIIQFSKIYSRRQIDKFGYRDLCIKAGLEPNAHSQTTSPVEIVIRPPKILALDIETAPILANVWGLWENNVALNQIQRDWFILSFCAKFVGEDKIYYFDQRKERDIQNDKKLCEKIHALIESADIILTHNGVKFDNKKLNARFIYWNLPPISPKQQIDTLKVAKKYFSFTSNKLEYLANYLKCTPKEKHDKFPGFSLWSECLKGNKSAFMAMEEYNRQDVETLIEVFEKLKSWDTSIDFQSFYQSVICICGSKEFYKHGVKYQKNGAFQIYRCKSCSKCYVDKSNMIDKDIRSGFLK